MAWTRDGFTNFRKAKPLADNLAGGAPEASDGNRLLALAGGRWDDPRQAPDHIFVTFFAKIT